ncbi:MAG TPA: hypothetical protein VE574_02560, partial [Nitrososphaeraceae archaeon]|nr:hypothetical protein [Nitrososphaeraceae archaeon]
EELEDAIAEYLKKEISGKREDETRNDTEKLTQTLDTVLLHQDSWIVSKVRKEYGTQTYIRVLFCENTTLAEVYKSRNFTFYTQFTETYTQILFLIAFTLKMSSQDGTIPVGSRVTKQQRDELQRWVSYFASQRSIDLELVGHYST